MKKLYELLTMPASSQAYYDSDVFVKYTGTTTSEFRQFFTYKATYDDATGIYSWEPVDEYNSLNFTEANLVYLLTKLTYRLK